MPARPGRGTTTSLCFWVSLLKVLCPIAPPLDRARRCVGPAHRGKSRPLSWRIEKEQWAPVKAHHACVFPLWPQNLAIVVALQRHWRGKRDMKAITWHGKGNMRCESVPDPRIEHPRDAIIKVTAC